MPQAVIGCDLSRTDHARLVHHEDVAQTGQITALRPVHLNAGDGPLRNARAFLQLISGNACHASCAITIDKPRPDAM